MSHHTKLIFLLVCLGIWSVLTVSISGCDSTGSSVSDVECMGPECDPSESDDPPTSSRDFRYEMTFIAGSNGWRSAPPTEWESIQGSLADSFGAHGRLKIDSAWIDLTPNGGFTLTSKRITRLTPFNVVPVDTTFDVLVGDYEQHGSLLMFRPAIGKHFFGSFIGDPRSNKLRLTFLSDETQLFAFHADFRAVVPSVISTTGGVGVRSAALKPPEGESFPIHECGPRHAQWLDAAVLDLSTETYQFLFSIRTSYGGPPCLPASSEQVAHSGELESQGPIIKFSPTDYPAPYQEWPFYAIADDSIIVVYQGPFRHYGPWEKAEYRIR